MQLVVALRQRSQYALGVAFDLRVGGGGYALAQQMLGFAPQTQAHAHHGGQVLQERVARLGALGGLDARHPFDIGCVVLGQQARFQLGHEVP